MIYLSLRLIIYLAEVEAGVRAGVGKVFISYSDEHIVDFVENIVMVEY